MKNISEIKVPLEDFYKDDDKNKIWLTGIVGQIGDFLFSFDKKTVFNFWADYPDNLTKEQIEIFRKECPEMAKLKD